jgi:acetyltransferase
MSVRNLNSLFEPRSIAVVGASNRPRSIGAALMTNLIRAGFKGPIYPVNPNESEVLTLPSVDDVAALPEAPDLAIIATPPDTVAPIVAELGKKGTKATVVLTAGFEGAEGKKRTQQLLEAARPHLLRIVGPNCLGIAVPNIGVNATFAPAATLPGNLALLTQSGAIATSVLDWAQPRGIGFSAVVSVGDMIDVDFGDLLDYFALDRATEAILIYAEGITHARKFMSAARRAARLKPVVAIKAGRAVEGARAASSHTGALAGADAVYDAAFRRAGILRVNGFEEVFDAAATLARTSRQAGDELVIVSNGGGAGVLATDQLIAEGGRLAPISAQTMAKLDAVLPGTWSRANPIDIIGDAGTERYARTMTALLEDPKVQNILVIYCPNSIITSVEAADGIATVLSGRQYADKNIFACWIGEATVRAGRARLAESRVPNYETPERAIRSFMYRVHYRQSQRLLLETPSAISPIRSGQRARARTSIKTALADGREWLDAIEIADFLACYDIPFVRTAAAADGEAAAKMVHKSDVGGVMLNLVGVADIKSAARNIAENVSNKQPEARQEGFIVQQMIQRPSAYELIAGVTTDPVFGPLILFGQGGTAVEVVHDKSLELPPLNTALARAQISRTRVAALLKGFRDRPPVDIDGLVNVLMRLSNIVADHDEVSEIDINPLLCDPQGVIAVDCRIRVRATNGERQARMAIRPYPQHLESEMTLRSGQFAIRPIRPEDEAALQSLAENVGKGGLWHPFFAQLRERSHQASARLTQIDYDREMTLTAWDGGEMAALARSVTDPDFETADCAVIARPGADEHELSGGLLEALLAAIAAQGIRNAELAFQQERREMALLAVELGFALKSSGQWTIWRKNMKK